jgi:hypothetical protein
MFDLFMADGFREVPHGAAADQSLDVVEHLLHLAYQADVLFQVVRLVAQIMLLSEDVTGRADFGDGAVHAAVRLHERIMNGRLWRGFRPYFVVFHEI